METRFVSGQWNAICDRCGFEHKSGQLKLEWTGLRTCPTCWEPRHPQDFVRGKPDRQNVAWSRPDAPPVFITTPVTGDDL